MFEELKLPGAQQDGVVTRSGEQLQREHTGQGVAPQYLTSAGTSFFLLGSFPVISLLYGFPLPEVSSTPSDTQICRGLESSGYF